MARGVPKSHNVSKAIDKMAGAEREIVGSRVLKGRAAQSCKDKGGTYTAAAPSSAGCSKVEHFTADATPEAKRWTGWGTALKPAWEPIILARKPFKGTVAANVLKHGSGALNIDGSRVGSDVIKTCGGKREGNAYGDWAKPVNTTHTGRWPANFIHDGSDDVINNLPNDTARFFYCAKANKKDRDEGLDGFGDQMAQTTGMSGARMPIRPDGTIRKEPIKKNIHPTVKPTELMRYLCRLITPPGGTVLDPFMGSGSTGKAAIQEGFGFVGIELDINYCEIAKYRCVS